MKPIIPTSRAEADVEQVVAYYLAEASFDAAVGFVDAYDKALAHIGRFPATGSARYATDHALEQLRFWLLDTFPYAVFYIERETCVEVIRVLHQSADIPSHLQY